MEVKNPRRILAVSSEKAELHLVRVIKDLTGIKPEQTSTSLAGSSHNLSLKTAYYTSEVPIWLDLISSPEEWSASFLSAEAKEVLEVLGGIMVVFPLPTSAQSDEGKAAQDLIKHVGRVVKDGLGGWGWDGVGLCLGVGEIDDVDVWEDCCAEWGLEFVQVRSSSTPVRNEFGEKTGIPRALEALESNDWSNPSVEDLDLVSDFEAEVDEAQASKPSANADDDNIGGPTRLDTEDLDFGFDKEDFAGLRRAIWNAGNEDDEENEEGFVDAGKAGTFTPTATATASATPGDADKHKNKDAAAESANNENEHEDGKDEEILDDNEIRKIERMMTKLQAVRDANVGLPEEQRKRAAARAVAEVMREL